MKLLIIFALLLTAFGTGDVLAQSTTPSTEAEQIAEARRRVVLAPGATRIGSGMVSVPMVGTKTLPLVNIMLNGKGPYRLLVDSAANVTLLQMRVADELALPVLRPGTSSKLVAVKSMKIGDAQFEDLVVGARAWDEDIDGVLGFNVFADCLLTMDYPKQRLIMRTGTLPPANGKDIFTYGLDNRSPTLAIDLGGERLNLLIDTGARQSVIVTEAIAAKLSFTSALTAGPQLSTFETARSQAQQGHLDGSIMIGIHEIVRPTVLVWSDIPLLGSDFFKDFVLTFDQRNRTLKWSV